MNNNEIMGSYMEWCDLDITLPMDMTEALKFELEVFEDNGSFPIRENLDKIETPEKFWKNLEWMTARKIYSKLINDNAGAPIIFSSMIKEKYAEFDGNLYTAMRKAQQEGKLFEMMKNLHSAVLYRKYQSKNSKNDEVSELKFEKNLNDQLSKIGALEENYSKEIKEKLDIIIEKNPEAFRLLSIQIDTLNFNPKKSKMEEPLGKHFGMHEAAIFPFERFHSSERLKMPDIELQPLIDFDVEEARKKIEEFLSKRKTEISEQSVIKAFQDAESLKKDFQKQEEDKLLKKTENLDRKIQSKTSAGIRR